MTIAALARKNKSAGPSKAQPPSLTVAGGLRIKEASVIERDADRAANEVTAPRTPRLHWSLANIGIEAQRRRTDADGLISLSQAAANLKCAQDRRAAEIRSHGSLRFRVPATADLKTLFNTGNVPESVLKDRVQTALTRMAEEKRLKSAESVPDIMKKIFPAAGGFDEAEYEKAVDVSDRTKVYQSVADAQTKVAAIDKPKLKTVITDCIKLVGECAADQTNLESVFGSKHSTAKHVYVMAKVALTTAVNHIDSSIETDYNLDDPETGLGGWADYASQHIHLESAVARVTNVNEAKITIIHEACHLANPNVDDKGYYGGAGFEAAKEEIKVTNAAHFEEIPRRKLGISQYEKILPPKPGVDKFVDEPEPGEPSPIYYDPFKPGASASGAALTFEQKVKSQSDDYLRKAWDKAVDVHGFFRDIRKEELAGHTYAFQAKKKRIMELSKLMHLTVHEQPANSASINQVDLVLAEGIAHGAKNAYEIGQKASVPTPADMKMPDPERFQIYTAFNKVIEDSIKAAGTITGNYADDKKLMDWMVAEYRRNI